MALEQSLISSTNLFFGGHKGSGSNTQISSLSLSPNPLSSLRLASCSNNSRYSRRLKCSADYQNHFNHQSDYPDHLNQHQVSYPKPSEISWRKELCNTVQLIGVVGTPVEIKHLPSGKVLAWTRLAVKKSATDTSWINLTFWDELAHIAFQHIEKGHQIYVSGRLVSDTVDNDEGKQQTYYKVVVQQVSFVERGLSSVNSHDRERSFIAAGRKFGNNASSNMGSTEELWQAFFANPVDWWDNRKNKRSPKYPDFKHKDTGEALWVEGRYNPTWVKSQLAILDTRLGSLHDQNSRTPVNIMADDFLPF